METYDLDDPKDATTTPVAGTRSRRRTWWWAGFAVLLLALAALGLDRDQQARKQEFDALLVQVTQGQSAVRYTDARIRATTEYVSPQLFSARAPAQVRVSLGAIVQQAATARIEPLQARREGVAGLSVARWHGDQRRARSAYLAYLNDRISFLQAASADVEVLFEPQPLTAGRLAAARQALLEVSPDARSADQIRDLLR